MYDNIIYNVTILQIYYGQQMFLIETSIPRVFLKLERLYITYYFKYSYFMLKVFQSLQLFRFEILSCQASIVCKH